MNGEIVTVADEAAYRQKALALAETVDLGAEGYVAKIPGFKGLLASGATKGEALKELESALQDWLRLAPRRPQLS